jgi:hypothetical protein
MLCHQFGGMFWGLQKAEVPCSWQFDDARIRANRVQDRGGFPERFEFFLADQY